MEPNPEWKMKMLEPTGIAFAEHTETALVTQVPWETLKLIEISLAQSPDLEQAFFYLKDIYKHANIENASAMLLAILRDIFAVGLARVALLKQEREQDAELSG